MQRKIDDNIIILGCQRSGKTTLTQILSSKEDYHIISVDALIYAFQNAIPQLNINRYSNMQEKSKILSPFLASYCESFLRNYPEKKFIIESCQLFPLDIMRHKLFNNCTIICLGYPNADTQEIFNAIRSNDSNYKNAYTKQLEDAELTDLIISWINYSKLLQKQCKNLNIKFYETNTNRTVLFNNIVNMLLNK